MLTSQGDRREIIGARRADLPAFRDAHAVTRGKSPTRAFLGTLLRNGRLLMGLKARRRARRYIPPEIGLERFFVTLRDRRIRYVVLRWFEDLPKVMPGADLDLLIHDDDIDPVSDLFAMETRGIACDLFSVSGLPGTSYRGIPYLPPDKAAQILARAGQLREWIRIPSLEDHFLSFAYHAIYQKGLRSGIPTSEIGLKPDARPRHDYAGDLARLAAELDIDVPITMEGLDKYLAGRGWRPPPHMLAELAERNSWLAAHFSKFKKNYGN